jgi:hypothetical protein
MLLQRGGFGEVTGVDVLHVHSPNPHRFARRRDLTQRFDNCEENSPRVP